MSHVLSPALAPRASAIGQVFSANSIPLDESGVRASPVLVVDDFRVTGQPFGPHPHAGFSAVTYVFEDSVASLRNRDSLGNDVIVGPGGIVWTQAGSGMLHEEMPAQAGRELHGLQVFVNLRAKHKLTPPRVLKLEGGEVPEWRRGGDRVRVLAGSYGGIASPLEPTEPLDFFDVELASQISLEARASHTAVLYVREGAAALVAGASRREIPEGHAVVVSGVEGRVALRASRPTRAVVLSGAAIDEPVYAHGPFIMNEPAQVDAAFARFRRGAMGHLAPTFHLPNQGDTR